MNSYIVIEVNNYSKKAIASATDYPTWELACEEQEALEEQHTENCYLVYSVDEWMYECENG